jgi:hypothetical protein
VEARALVLVERAALHFAVARGAATHKIRHIDARRDREPRIVTAGARWGVPAPVEGVLADGRQVGDDPRLGTAFARRSRIESICVLFDSVDSVTVYRPQVGSTRAATRRLPESSRTLASSSGTSQNGVVYLDE